MAKKSVCNVGFIGCGALMNAQHIQNAHKSKICKVHTLCDIKTSAIESTAAKYPPQKTTTDYKTLLADPEVDLVVIAMHPKMHAPLTLEALRMGKPVYVEKPLGVTIEEALEVDRLAKKMGLQVAVGFNRRFAPAYQDVKPLLKKREGPLLIYYRIAYHVRNERPDTNLIHIECCHIFDILAWLIDAEPISVYATEGLRNDNTLSLKFADGTSSIILSSGRASLEAPKEHLEIIWDHKELWVEDFIESRFFHIPKMPAVKRYKGRAYTGSPTDHVEGFAEKGLEYFLPLKKWVSDEWDAFDASKKADKTAIGYPINYLCDKGWGFALDEMAQAVIEQRPSQTAGTLEGARASVVADAALQSIKTGEVVKINSALWKIK